MYRGFLKRFIDLIFSLICFIILLPLFIIIAIIIKVTSKGPVFFRQKRIGKGKKIFTICKFRTMRADTPKDIPTHMFENSESYITSIGNFLRKTSLDEMPQILNIIKGDMSLIGPRPALYNQDDLVEERDKYNANDIRPGLSGLAQIKGRDTLEIAVKAKYDGDYVKNYSFFLDVKLFLLTFVKVFKRDGIKEGKTATLQTGDDEK